MPIFATEPVLHLPFGFIADRVGIRAKLESNEGVIKGVILSGAQRSRRICGS
ncbi:hypothetical protein [Edaphobacter modestus]|uniref:hypothetical protein n=1 Tax=Edaphobacter modestus TaxID=388466 RepID=UPI0013EEBFFC|nr:hypothetical protein [Edaphobacter modestus]